MTIRNGASLPRLRLAVSFVFVALGSAGCSSGDGDQDAGSGGLGSGGSGGAPAGADWPMLGGDLASTYLHPSETKITTDSVRDLSKIWEFDTGGNVNSTAAIVDGRVYVVAARGTFALEAANGNLVWENKSVRGTASAAVSNGVVYVSTGDAYVYALDAKDGAEKWNAQIDPHPSASGYSSPIVAGDLVVVGSSSGEEGVAANNATFRGGVVAYDAATGAERWRYYTVEPPFNGVTVWSTVTVDLAMNRVFASTGNNYTEDAGDTSDAILALELDTGKLDWLTQLTVGDVFTIVNPRSPDSDFGANPTLFDFEVDGKPKKLLAAGQKSGQMWVLDRETGGIVWNVKMSGGNPLSGGVLNNGAFDGERLLVASDTGTSSGPGSEDARLDQRTSVLFAFDPATGDIIWERQIGQWVWAPITVANGVGFVSSENRLEAFDTATGEQLYTTEIAGTITSGASISDGRIFLGGGMTYIVGVPDKFVRAFGVP